MSLALATLLLMILALVAQVLTTLVTLDLMILATPSL